MLVPMRQYNEVLTEIQQYFKILADIKQKYNSFSLKNLKNKFRNNKQIVLAAVRRDGL